MGLFPKFIGWINLNTQQPNPKAEMERYENVKSVPERETKNNPSRLEEKIYYNEEEEDKQDKLWYDAAMKHNWLDPPPKFKVTTKNGICHMNIELLVGFTPAGVFDLFTNPDGGAFFDLDKWRELLETKSRKVFKEDGPRQIARSKTILAWELPFWSIHIPINFIVDENRKDLTGQYKIEKMMFMKMLEGKYKVEPIYIDSERLCKQKFPKSKEEYLKCSNGKGRIASKVILNQYFQPYPIFNIPPVSWFIRGVTIKTTKTLIKTLLAKAKTFREAERDNW